MRQDHLVQSTDQSWDDISRERAAAVLRQAFVAAQLGMPAEDHETAVESLWIILEALLVDHLAPDPRTLADRAGRRTSIGNHWRRMVTSAVTHTFVLGGDFVMPEQLATAVEERAALLESGKLWHSRRPPGHGALVLRVHDDLTRLEATARAGRFAGPDDMDSLVDLIALATLGAVMAGEGATAQQPESTEGEQDESEVAIHGRWARTTESVAASFGIAECELIAVSRQGWVCAECGCLFTGRVEAGVAYPDRFAPIGRGGACDTTTECACPSAPLQREVR